MMPSTQTMQTQGATLTVLAGNRPLRRACGESKWFESFDLRKWHEQCSALGHCPRRSVFFIFSSLGGTGLKTDGARCWAARRVARHGVLGSILPFGSSASSFFRAVLVELSSLAWYPVTVLSLRSCWLSVALPLRGGSATSLLCVRLLRCESRVSSSPPPSRSAS
jgi:hypothetical protein